MKTGVFYSNHALAVDRYYYIIDILVTSYNIYKCNMVSLEINKRDNNKDVVVAIGVNIINSDDLKECESTSEIERLFMAKCFAADSFTGRWMW
jgi:hypothetical protein